MTSSAILLLFLSAGILFLLARMLFLRKTLELNLYNTYYIISKKTLATYLASVMLFFSFVYFLFLSLNYPLNSKLGFAHFIVTALGALMLVGAPISASPPGDYKKARKKMEYLTRFCLIGLIVFGLGQVILIFNIVRIIFLSAK